MTRCTFAENHFSGFGGIPFQLERKRNATLNACSLSEAIMHVFLEVIRSASSCNGKQRYQRLKITKEFVDIPIKNGLRDRREGKARN